MGFSKIIIDNPGQKLCIIRLGSYRQEIIENLYFKDMLSKIFSL